MPCDCIVTTSVLSALYLVILYGIYSLLENLINKYIIEQASKNIQKQNNQTVPQSTSNPEQLVAGLVDKVGDIFSQIPTTKDEDAKVNPAIYERRRKRIERRNQVNNDNRKTISFEGGENEEPENE